MTNELRAALRELAAQFSELARHLAQDLDLHDQPARDRLAARAQVNQKRIEQLLRPGAR